MSSRSEVNSQLLAFKNKHGHVAMRDLIQRVAGVSAISEIAENKLGAILAACCDPSPKVKGPAMGEAGLDPVAIYAKWNSAKRAPKREEDS